MADKKVNVIIALKDGISDGLKKITGSTNTLNDAFKKLGAAAAAYLSFTAIKNGFMAVVGAFAESEAASVRLSNTFSALGENGKDAADKWGAYAASLMKVTTYDDEVILGLVTTAKTMGISNEQIKFATEGAIGLAKAFGLDLNTSMKMTTMAMEGEYSMLSRYIPALRTANSEGEKASIVQRAMAVGFAQATSETGTLEGASQSLKVAFSESMETMGASIAGEGGLVSLMGEIKVKMEELAKDGSLKEWGENAGRIFSGLVNALKPVASVIGGITEGWTNLGILFKTGASGIGTLLGGGKLSDVELKPLVGSDEAKIKSLEEQTAEIKRQASETATLEQQKKTLLEDSARKKADLIATTKNKEAWELLTIRRLEAEGNEAALLEIKRKGELSKLTTTAQKQALLEIYAIEDARAAQKKQVSTPQEAKQGGVLGFGEFSLGEQFSLQSKEVSTVAPVSLSSSIPSFTGSTGSLPDATGAKKMSVAEDKSKKSFEIELMAAFKFSNETLASLLATTGERLGGVIKGEKK